MLAAVYLGYQNLENTTIEELATEEGEMSQFDEMVKSGEDPETVKRILEGMGMSLEGREPALQETQHITLIDAEPHGEPSEAVRQLVWSNTAHALSTLTCSTEGYDGDQDKIQDVGYPISTQLDDLLSQLEFQQDHPQSSRYRDQLNTSHIRRGWAVDQLLLLNVLYGSSRGDPESKKIDLNRFTHSRGKSTIPVLADRSPSEAIVLEVDRRVIVNWLVANRILREDADDDSRRAIPDVDDEQVLQEWSLTDIATTEIENPFDDIEDEITDAAYILFHLMSHCLLARADEQCGLATDTLGERASPSVPAIVIYAAMTESFSLGSMSTLPKIRPYPQLSQACKLASDRLLDSACAEDPEGAAYDACIYIPETPCEYFNHALDHRLLEGGGGFVGFQTREISNGMGIVRGAEQDVASTASDE